MAGTETGTLYRYGIKITPKGNHDLQFKRPKLEIGTVATDWSPAPEDPDEELYERISVLQTDFSVVQGEIQAKVWETDIEKATDGLYESMNEIYAYIDETVNGISASVGDLTYTVENNYSILTAQISDLVITNDSITSLVEALEQEIFGYTNYFTHINDGEIDTPNYWDNSDVVSTGKYINNFNILSLSSGLPAGKYYMALQANSRLSSNGIHAQGFYWAYSQNLISEKIDELIIGETYTYSFYVSANFEDTYHIFPEKMVFHQTVLSCNFDIVGEDDNFGKYGEVYLSGDPDDWVRISITFRLDTKSTWFGFVYNPPNDGFPMVYMCGLMLNVGATAGSWNDGVDTSNFATTSYVASEIQQLSDSILATVTNIQVALNGDITALYADLQILSDSINATVGNVEVTVNNYYTETMEKIASLQIETDSISSTVANITSDIYKVLEPRNLLLHTDDGTIDIPYAGYANELNGQLSTWEIMDDNSLEQPVGTTYIHPTLKVSYTNYNVTIKYPDYSLSWGNVYWGGFHWTDSSNIITDKFDELVEGETYTFSFYMSNNVEVSEMTTWLFVDNIVYGQTVLSASETILDSDLGRLCEIKLNYKEWKRVWVTFKLNDKANFRFGPVYGRSLRDYLNNIVFCGFMLNEGATVATWDDGERSVFATTDWVYSQIQQLTNSITLSVNSKTNGSASIVLSVDGEETSSGDILANGTRYAFANDTSAITISAGTVTFNSNTFIVNSTYFSVTAAGVITATSGKIGGWTIGSSSLYNGPTSIIMATTGIYMGTDGFRSNSGIGTVISDGVIQFYDSSNMPHGTIQAYENNAGWGLWIGKKYEPVNIIGPIYVEQSSGSNSLVAGKNVTMYLQLSNGSEIFVRFSNGILTDYV